MDIQKLKIYDLKPARYNPRKTLKKDDKEYQKIKKSIEQFGYVELVIVNKDMTIIGGHQRVNVLKELGYSEIQCIVLDIDKTKEKQLNIALNKITGEWDNSKLKDLLTELSILEEDTEVTGFDIDEVNKIIGKVEKEEPEMDFTDELLEEHNYLVLYFDNSLDWQVALEKFEVPMKDTLHSNKRHQRKGIGRIIKGSEVLKKLK